MSYAGCLKDFIHQWKELTSNKNVLSCISGYKIPFASQIYQSVPPRETLWSTKEIEIISVKISELLVMGAVQRVESCEGQFISKIFIIPKPNGTHRLILNLKGLNKFIVTEHFKLEDGKTVRRMISPGCYMATLDLKDAYHLIPVAETDKKFFRFTFLGELYEYTCLPFGLSTAPYTFTKLMKPVMFHLRYLGYKSVIYLDDLLLFGNSAIDCQRNIEKTCACLKKLGFIINMEKSSLVPSLRIKYLGLIYDSGNMTVELPEDKKLKIISQIGLFKDAENCKIRDFAAFVGTLGSCCETLKYGRVYLRNFEYVKVLALQKNNDDYEATMSLSDISQKDLHWCDLNIRVAINSINCFTPRTEIFTDASLTGWGVVCEGKRAHGFWTETEKSKHINNLEVIAAMMGLKCFANDLRNCDVLLRVDNTTAIAYINKKGGVQFRELNKLAKKIWIWCEERDLLVFASYRLKIILRRILSQGGWSLKQNTRYQIKPFRK